MAGKRTFAQGVRTVLLPGHTPGQQGLRVATENRTVVLASDALHFYDELRRDWPFIIVDNLSDFYRSIDRLRAMEDAGDVVIPGHDAEVADQFESRRHTDGPTVGSLL